MVAACVTINVYFPEAAAEEAADRFIENVIGTGPEGEGESTSLESMDGQPLAVRVSMRFLEMVIPAAHAQADIDINTPAIRQIQARMSSRFDAELQAHFNSGAVGFTNDAMIAIRDLGAVPLRDRNGVKASVAAENKDRNAVYREIAVANGHPEWEGQIRSTFAQRWIARARPGWYYQNAAGAWVQK
jgi:uncharacterized protein YdbL (DUF1318 family)